MQYVLDALAALPAESAHCVVTCPLVSDLALVDVFRAVRRVLRTDGTLWLALDGPVGQPWRVAFALQADGWWLRSDVVVEQADGHMYLFLLAVSKTYFYDHVAVLEPHNLSYVQRRLSLRPGVKSADPSLPAHRKSTMSLRYDGVPMGDPRGRNRRTVWSTLDLDACVRAGTSERGVCAVCGASWRRETKRTGIPPQTNRRRALASAIVKTMPSRAGGTRCSTLGAGVGGDVDAVRVETVGWLPACNCDVGTVPATVLDPFASQAVDQVVRLCGRTYVGVYEPASVVRPPAV